MNYGPHGIRSEAHRPVVMSRRGMVCSGHPLASQAGAGVLQQGGNAVDAAIAVAAALNLVEPDMSGIGGDGFMMIYEADSGEINVANGTGAAPRRANREEYRPRGIPSKGARSVSVPGLVSAWLAAHQRYGKLKLAQAFQPAIDLARDGWPISHRQAESIATEPTLMEIPSSREIFGPAGRPLRAGETCVNPDLARTFERIIAGGADEFYRGETAQLIAKCSETYDGHLSASDLEEHRMRWQPAISTSYRGRIVYEAPPNSSGHVLLQELNLAGLFDLASLGYNTPESVHLMVEAKKLAFADREQYLDDPEWFEVPIEGLLSKEYARERANLIDMSIAATDVRAGEPWKWQAGGKKEAASVSRTGPEQENTTCFVVVDRWGNAVCQLQSIQNAWGSGLVVPRAGFLLNNRMTYWHLEDDHIDSLEPGKRVRHTMNPVMVFEDGRLVLVCGTPGADTQVQTNFQMLTHVFDFGLTINEAVESPRWRHTQDGTESEYPHTCEDLLYLESRFDHEFRKAMDRRGHHLAILEDWGATGSEMMIQVNPASGALCGAADPRRDGYAIGW